MNIPIEITQGRLSLNYDATPQQFFADYQNRLRGTILATSAAVGYTNQFNPIHDVGPWYRYFPGSPDVWQWYGYDSTLATYVPIQPQLGDADNQVSFVLGSTNGPSDPLTEDDPVITLPDKTGTAGLTVDLYIPRATLILTGTALTVNCFLSDNFIHRMTGNSVYNISTISDGQEVTIDVQNNGTQYTATWSASILWPGGVQPTQPVSVSGSTVTGRWRFKKVVSTIYGTLDNYKTSPSTVITVGGQGDNPNYTPAGPFGPGQGQHYIQPQTP